MVPEIWCARDRQTDRKSGIWRWVPQLKLNSTFLLIFNQFLNPKHGIETAIFLSFFLKNCITSFCVDPKPDMVTEVYLKLKKTELDIVFWRPHYGCGRRKILAFTPPRFLENAFLKTRKVSYIKEIQHKITSLQLDHICYMMIICYTVPEIWDVTNIIVIFYFGLFFALSPP